MRKLLKILHVDDNPAQLERVSQILSEFENVILTAQFDNATDALKFLEMNRVDIAILDIEMKGKDGLWLADKIKKMPLKIVFLTAHPDYALKAFEACALHYIIKPATEENFAEIINRYMEIMQHSGEKMLSENQIENINELLSNYLNKASYPKRIFINNVHKTTILQLEEVVHITSKGAYSEFKTLDGQKYTSSKNLRFFDDILKSHPDFVRIHRGSIINKNFLKAIIREQNNIRVIMSDETQLDVSPLRREEIIEQLKK